MILYNNISDSSDSSDRSDSSDSSDSSYSSDSSDKTKLQQIFCWLTKSVIKNKWYKYFWDFFSSSSQNKSAKQFFCDNPI